MAKSAHRDDDATTELDGQRRRHIRLQERQRLIAQELAQRSRELEKAKADARAAYGTDDLDALAALLAERRAKHAKALQKFKDSLDAVEQRLAAIEAKVSPV
ncbi:MAG TPA: hypothetical protein VEH84_14110 [Alphaproteobacteria bacterium]|nr:hypothetical protein [Alphaproteobacteria bacterium]